ncbi:MAG: PDZ domain-containing protein, partial [Calditrichaeota bacterium]
VRTNSPADRAGISSGEVIVSVEDAVVSSPEDLEKILQSRKPGDVVKLRIKRVIGANNVLDRLVFVEVPARPSN